MKKILPWTIAAIAFAAVALLYKSGQSKSAERASLERQVQELTGLQAELDELKKNRVSPEELARLRKNAEDLVRLRNSVQQLTEEKSQLSQQKQQAQSAADLARTQIQAAQAQAQAAQVQAAAVAQTNQLANMTPEQQAAAAAMRARYGLDGSRGSPEALAKATANACINNMRQIDSAIQQWALEANKQASDLPDRAAFVKYIKGNALPVCPGGGAYTIGATVATIPSVTCNQPGHQLPQ
jgi:DNA mismatch repair ATPase MutS